MSTRVLQCAAPQLVCVQMMQMLLQQLWCAVGMVPVMAVLQGVCATALGCPRVLLCRCVSLSLPCLQIAAWLAARALQLDATTGQLPEALQLLELAVDKGYGPFQVQLPDSGTSVARGSQEQQPGGMGEEHVDYNPNPSCFGGGVPGRQPLYPVFVSAAVVPTCFGGKACTYSRHMAC